MLEIVDNRRLHLKTKTGWLRRKAIRGVSRSTAGVTPRPGSDHETVSEDGCVVLDLLLLLLLGLPSLVVRLQECKLLCLLSQHVDHVRHGEVVQAIAPRQLQNEIGTEQIVAGVQHADVALTVAHIDELE